MTDLVQDCQDKVVLRRGVENLFGEIFLYLLFTVFFAVLLLVHFGLLDSPWEGFGETRFFYLLPFLLLMSLYFLLSLPFEYNRALFFSKRSVDLSEWLKGRKTLVTFEGAVSKIEVVENKLGGFECFLVSEQRRKRLFRHVKVSEADVSFLTSLPFVSISWRNVEKNFE